jgi:hypothetical protein
MAALGSWASIEQHGLLSATALLDLFKVEADRRETIETRKRSESIVIARPQHGSVTTRDRGSTRVPSTFFRRVPRQSLHGLRRALSQLTDGGDADPGEARLGGGAHAPQQCDGQLVKELEFSFWIDDDESIRFRDLRCDFARCLVRATPIDIGKPSSVRTRARAVIAISAEGSARWWRRLAPSTSALRSIQTD